MESVTSLDSTGALTLQTWIKEWRNNDIDLYIIGAKGPVRDVLVKWQLIETIGEDHIFLDTHTALTYYEKNMDDKSLQKMGPYSLQSNFKNKKHRP